MIYLIYPWIIFFIRDNNFTLSGARGSYSRPNLTLVLIMDPTLAQIEMLELLLAGEDRKQWVIHGLGSVFEPHPLVDQAETFERVDLGVCECLQEHYAFLFLRCRLLQMKRLQVAAEAGHLRHEVEELAPIFRSCL